MKPHALLHPINCAYDPNQTIPLYDGEVEINQLRLRANAFIEWFPYTGIACEVSDSCRVPSQFVMNAEENYSFCIPPLSTMLGEYHCRYRTGRISNTVQDFSVRIDDNYREVRYPPSCVSSAVFHIPNFTIGSRVPIGLPIQYPDGSSYAGRIELESDRFSVQLDLAYGVKGRLEQLKQNGSYLFTHIGRIEWKDGPGVNLKRDLDIVAFYLWFVTGRQTGPCLTATFNENGNQIDQSWDIRSVDMYRQNGSWVVTHDRESFITAFPEFVRLCSVDPAKRDIIFEVIHWYVESRSEQININSCIVLLQAALEKIASLFLTENEFNNTNAPQKIERLLGACGIPNVVPAHFQIRNQTALQDIESISAAITRVRNKTVHPSATNMADLRAFESQAPEGISEVYDIGVWTLQLVLLKLFNYSKKYRSIVANAEVDVPWV
jgi:hypothetical protein